MGTLFKIPSLVKGTFWLLALLLWRAPSVNTTESHPKQPRRPILYHCPCPMPDGVAAIVRFSWFKQGRAKEVEEFCVECHEDWTDTLCYLTINALHHGADVYLLSDRCYEDLQISEHIA